MTQVDQVQKHLLDGKSITPATALAVYGIYRLSSVIEDLRLRGHQIDTLMKRDEMGKQYGEYRLHKKVTLASTVQVRPGHGIGLPNWVRRLKEAKVIAAAPSGAVQVRFVRGLNRQDIWMLDKELVRVD